MTVPRGYAAYARVLDPVNPKPAAEPTTWARVCARTGRTAHALMQWDSITTPTPSAANLLLSSEGRWDDAQVQRGCLALQTLNPLLDVLTPFTTDPDGPQACQHAVWDGWGWLTGGRELGRVS